MDLELYEEKRPKKPPKPALPPFKKSKTPSKMAILDLLP
jgi:hypothetical protein